MPRVPVSPHPVQHLVVSLCLLGRGYSDRCVVATHVLLCFNLHVPNGILKKELYLAIVMNLKLSIFNFSIISVSDFAICSDEPAVHTILLDL